MSVEPPLGTPIALTLATTRRADAETFYTGLFGWTFTDHPAGPTGQQTLIYAGDAAIATAQPAAGIPVAGWVITLLGPADAADRITAAGGRVLGHGDAIIYAADPGGAVFAVTPDLPHPALPAPAPGRPVWFENMTTNAAAVDHFYAQVFELQPQSTTATHYALLLARGRPVAGRLALPPDLTERLGTRWMVYVAHPHVDQAATQVPDLGGTVLVPPRDTPTGRVAAVAAPDGAVLTLLTPARA